MLFFILTISTSQFYILNYSSIILDKRSFILLCMFKQFVYISINVCIMVIFFYSLNWPDQGTLDMFFFNPVRLKNPVIVLAWASVFPCIVHLLQSRWSFLRMWYLDKINNPDIQAPGTITALRKPSQQDDPSASDPGQYRMLE